MGTIWVLFEKPPNFFGTKPSKKSQIKQKTTLFSVVFVVDDTRLELVTSRTSSGCATSCANRPALSSKGYSNAYIGKCQEVFCIFFKKTESALADPVFW